ncbi:MAG: AI-2E family transporter [Mycobacteriales bacterium]
MSEPISAGSEKRRPAVVTNGVRVPRSLATSAAYSWRFLVVVAAAYIVLRGLVLLRIVVLPVIIAVLFASVLVRPLRALRRRGLGRGLTAAMVVLLALLIMVTVIAVVSRSVVNGFDELTGNLDQGLREVQDWFVTGPLGLERAQVEDFANQVRTGAADNRAVILSGLAKGAHVAAEVVAGLFLSLFVLFFMLKDGDRIWAAIVRLFPPDRQEAVDVAGQRSFVTIGSYLRGVSITALVDAVLIAIVLLVLDIPLVLALAALTFFGAFIPLIGATLAGAVAALVALVDEGPVAALIVVGAIIAIQQIEGHVLAPIVLGRAVELHPLAVALSLAAGAVIAGITGALLAVPATAVVTTCIRTFGEHATSRPYEDDVLVGSG